MSSNTVAVAIACYNHARFLNDAIASIQGQSRRADEIILIDDGSTDDTANVAKHYPMVDYYKQANAGLSAARNRALEICRADTILFLDADDILLPDALWAAAERYNASPRCAFVYGNYVERTDDLQTRDYVTSEPSSPFEALLEWNFIGMHGTVLYDVHALRGIGGFDTSLRQCEDYDVYLKIAKIWPIGHYPTVAAEYRRQADSLSSNAFKMLVTLLAVIRRHTGPSDSRKLQKITNRGIKRAKRFYGNMLARDVLRNVRLREYATAVKIAIRMMKYDFRFPLRIVWQWLKLEVRAPSR